MLLIFSTESKSAVCFTFSSVVRCTVRQTCTQRGGGLAQWRATYTCQEPRNLLFFTTYPTRHTRHCAKPLVASSAMPFPLFSFQAFLSKLPILSNSVLLRYYLLFQGGGWANASKIALEIFGHEDCSPVEIVFHFSEQIPLSLLERALAKAREWRQILGGAYCIFCRTICWREDLSTFSCAGFLKWCERSEHDFENSVKRRVIFSLHLTFAYCTSLSFLSSFSKILKLILSHQKKIIPSIIVKCNYFLILELLVRYMLLLFYELFFHQLFPGAIQEILHLNIHP